MEIDASNFVWGIILSQLGEGNLITFHFHKFSLAWINYEIHDKEILTIVDAFEEWHHLFEGPQHEINVYSDHKDL